LLFQPEVQQTDSACCRADLESLDTRTLLSLCEPALERTHPVSATIPIRNTERAVGTRLGSEVTRRYGPDGLPPDTIQLTLVGSAGQSFGAFVPRGITLRLEGDANDYLGKGLSGGKLVIVPPADATFTAEENVIAGNVALYGATSGEAYINGMVGERFCVRNSGANVVVEAVGDHGCEYMTGGRVIVLGEVGKNFAAGMSGGIAYLFDENQTAPIRCNRDMVSLLAIEEQSELDFVRDMIVRHAEYTGSARATALLDSWDQFAQTIVKVMPNDYRRVLEEEKRRNELELNLVSMEATSSEGVLAAGN